ncbi:hypothetical protein [Oscillatoria sp. HE19RPO]|uniref:hypothetical protein n=1 Tax=Oscillatoria sp. HE19RPO TaxID=2954806 RepID=UPI0020C4E56D|nr:hypothetical protein [Oscillatoria sp. HE19RPO]
MNPKPSDRIFAPNIYLCAYYLSDDARENHPLWQECDRLLDKLASKPESLKNHLDFSQSRNGERQILLQGKPRIDFTLKNDDEIEVYAQPLKLSEDSYALVFNVGYDEENESTPPEVEVNLLNSFNPENCLLLPKSDDNFLGQTILLTAWITTKTKQRNATYLQNLANTCYQELLGKNAPPLYRSGELFGSSIFEYGKPREADNSPHVLIWLFRDEAADRTLQDCFDPIFDMFFYRSKIVKAFQDSRNIYDELKQDYKQLDPFFDNLQKKLDSANPDKDDSYLDEFKTQLKQLACDSLEYTRLLRKLEDFANTIEINLYNYNETIEQICATLGTDKEELSFLQHFSQQTAPYFYRQIQGDLGYFEHGTELVEQAIASIRGIVEIDQAKRDRQIETAIYVIGAGLTGAGIAASSSGYLTAGSQNGEMTIQWIPDFSHSIHPFTKVLGISIAIGVVLGVVALLIRKLIELKSVTTMLHRIFKKLN